jgi:hypothetical protein
MKPEQITEIKQIISSEMSNTWEAIMTAHVNNYHKHPNNYDRSGSPWSPSEDGTLANEVKTFLTNTAKAHGRSFGAIASRIRRNDLMFISENE